MKYHHLGIPTSVVQEGETYLEGYGVHRTDHERNPFGSQSPNSPSPGVRVAFVLADGAPVEFLQIDKREA